MTLPIASAVEPIEEGSKVRPLSTGERVINRADSVRSVDWRASADISNAC